MRTFLVSLMTLASLLGLASVTHSHVGDQVCFFHELLDEGPGPHRLDRR